VRGKGRARGSVVFGSAGSGLGAGRCPWVILAGSVYVHGSGAAQV
jgi:hypothetical protein